MFRLKRLYSYMLQQFLPLFFMTFGICLFIVLMQFVWRSIDDMVGKGLSLDVLGEMFWYAALNFTPMALPLAILLASLMTFGNLGESFELLAMKSAGVSLIRIMRPLIIVLAFISIGAFFFQNNLMPIVQVKFYALYHSIKQKSPELEIPEGVFYGEIQGYNVYVREKDNKTGLLKDVMIYDYSEGPVNAKVILADSGRMKTSADNLFLVLSLYNGESFSNLNTEPATTQLKEAVPYQREAFEYREILIEFDANFERTDESLLSNQYIGKNLADLEASIDSMGLRIDSIKARNADNIYTNSYRKSISTIAEAESSKKETGGHTVSEPVNLDNFALILNFDSVFINQDLNIQASILSRAKSAAENTKSEYLFRTVNVEDELAKYRRHIVEWHKKFTLSFACLIFFFIGAPLGAIIRKGGLGMPVVISVLFFIFYYVIDTIGMKMAREGVWPAWQGMWLSSFILAPLGVFLTYKAVNDSVIMNADTYLNALKNLFGKRSGRKVERKEVIIFNPDYLTLMPRLQHLAEECGNYLQKNRRWINYLKYWKQGGKDNQAEELSKKVEDIAEELGNSDNILVLNKLMDYPIMSGYSQFNLKLNLSHKVGFVIAILFPIGIPIYLIAVYRRKLLRQDVAVVQKTSLELYDMIAEL